MEDMDNSLQEISHFEHSENSENSQIYENSDFEVSHHENSCNSGTISQTLGLLNSSITERSNLEDSLDVTEPTIIGYDFENLDNSSQNDVFAFHDDTPPVFRAPEIREEDLFEISVASDQSDEISIASSELLTSGSSTDSEPYGHLNFSEPQMTSTPYRKKKETSWNRRSKLQMRKNSKQSIRKALFEMCSCPKRCTSKQSFTKELVERCHKMVWDLNKEERQNWLHQKFEESQCLKRGKFKFHLMGHHVCPQSWMIAHGINKNTYYRERKKWMKCTPNIKTPVLKLKEKRLAAINWFGEYVATRGENPPHIQEIWLPFGLRKNEIYAAYKAEFDMQEIDCITMQTFLNIWNDHFPNVKIKQTNMFTRCNTCDKLDRALSKQLNPEKKQELYLQKQAHLQRQMKEKSAYYRRKTISRQRPDRYISLIIDGMDQSKTNIPHFKGRPSKEFAATRQVNVHVTGVLSHGTNKKYLFTDLHQYKHDSNLTLNILMKVLWEHSKGQPLPPILYLQADNCFRENKNKFVLSFLELLVRRKLFYEIQLSFLHVGHTHEDVDQMFSVIADTLRHNDATTLPSLQQKLYNAKDLQGCYDISGWLTPHLRIVKHHTKTSMFRFRYEENTKDVRVMYRKNVDQSWKHLKGGFFKQNLHGNAALPLQKPSILEASFDKLDIPDIKKSLKIWQMMMDEDGKSWWENYIRQLEEHTRKIKQYSKTDAVWIIDKIPKYNQSALQDSENDDAIPDHIVRLLEEEEQNPEIILPSTRT